MSFMSPDMPEAPDPAKRPERRGSVKPEDVVVGEDQEADTSTPTGRRALRRPAGQTGASVGTGLSA